MGSSPFDSLESPEYWKLYEVICVKVNLDEPAEYSNIVKVELAVLDEVQSRLPQRAREALNVAKHVHAGELSEDKLEEQRIAMWTLLEGKSCDFQDPGVCAIRALICALAPFSAEDWETQQQDPLEVFLEFCEGADFPATPVTDALRAVYLCD